MNSWVRFGAFFVLVLAAALFTTRCASPPPSIQELQSYLDQNRSGLSDLVSMAREDLRESGTHEITPELLKASTDDPSTEKATSRHLSASRAQRYRDRFSALKLAYGLRLGGESLDAVLFPIWLGREAGFSAERGLVFANHPPPTRNETDLIIAVAPLSENWYAYDLKVR